jgi:predicted Zn-dependent protease
MSERAILAAQGYLELGMAKEALTELESLHLPEDRDPDLLELRLHVLMQAKRWPEVIAAAGELIRIRADALPAYIHGAYALHELGRTREALEFLREGPGELRDDPTFHYNVACYEAVLGNREAALESLDRSFALEGGYRDFARWDPDLESLRDALTS